MSKKRKKGDINDLIKGNPLPNSFEELNRYKMELEAKEMLLIEKALTSNSPHSIVQAKEYIKGLENKKQSTLQAFTFAPEHEFYSGLGYKNKPTGLTYDLLRQMSKVPQISAIIQTRIDQAMNFGEFSTDMNVPGWSIVKRTGKFSEDKDKELTSQDKRNIEGLITWIENGGSDVNEWEGDDWTETRKKIFNDSWVLDQGAFEVSWLRKGIPYQYQAVDGGSIRLAENLYNVNDEEVNGYLPKYVQVWKSQMVKLFYPWELCLGMRNKSSYLMNNGYSNSELEILIQVITWMLYGMQYNGNFFQQGSNPKGLLNFKGNVSQDKLEEFKQGWRNTVSGVWNSHKLAVTAGSEVEWVNMQNSNKDMEFHQWNEFLTVLACVIFRIDPDEVGFHLSSSKGLFGQDGQKARIAQSQEKGLEPFMKYWQSQFDKYMIKSLSGGKYEFIFTGLNPEDQESALDRDIKIVTNGGMSLQDFFLKYSKKELDIKKDILLNQIALQYKQIESFGGEESNNAVDDMGGDENDNPFKQFNDTEKSEDPFFKAFDGYLKSKKISD